MEEWAVAKANCPVEKYGDVDHQIKKARVEGMKSQVEKNIVKSFIFANQHNACE